jgi:hypothetical protein
MPVSQCASKKNTFLFNGQSNSFHIMIKVIHELNYSLYHKISWNADMLQCSYHCYLDESGLASCPAPLIQGESPGAHWTGDWVNPINGPYCFLPCVRIFLWERIISPTKSLAGGSPLVYCLQLLMYIQWHIHLEIKKCLPQALIVTWLRLELDLLNTSDALTPVYSVSATGFWTYSDPWS